MIHNIEYYYQMLQKFENRNMITILESKINFSYKYSQTTHISVNDINFKKTSSSYNIETTNN